MIRIRFLLACLVTFMLAGLASAQDAPVVQVAFFYSPTCPHCHDVMDDVFPVMQERFGEQLEIFYIDVSKQAAVPVFYDACDALNVPQDRCGGVPAMVIGSEFMVGSAEIPARMPGLVEAGIRAGGVDLSSMPMLHEAYVRASGNSAEQTAVPTATLVDRLLADPIANSAAVVTLVVLLVSGVIAFRGIVTTTNGKLPGWITSRTSWFAVLALTVSGVVLASTLTFELSFVSLLAGLVAVILIGVAFAVARRADTPLSWHNLLPAVAVAGLLVAGYLAYVEVGQNEAICGLVGECAVVQSSEYAVLFGVLPVGVLGIIGYLAILGAWAASNHLGDRWHVVLLGLILFGVAFSAYLTFLEPFVIGASCAWCLTSAVLMLVLFWLEAPRAYTSLQQLNA